MDRVNGADWVDIGGGRRGFRGQNKAAGVSGTEVTAAFLNSVQEEILKVIEETGLDPSPDDMTQLWQALNRMILPGFAGRLAWLPVLSVTTAAPPVSPALGDTYVIPDGASGGWTGHEQKLAIWIGADWAIVPTKDGHGVGLPDGRVFSRRGGVYVELAATDTIRGLVTLNEIRQTGGAAALTALTRVWNNFNALLPNAVITTVDFTDFSSDGQGDFSHVDGGLTCLRAGRYVALFSGGMVVQSHQAAALSTGVRHNGAEMLSTSLRVGDTAGSHRIVDNITGGAAGVYDFVVGDRITCWAFQDSSGTQHVRVRNSLTLYRLTAL